MWQDDDFGQTIDIVVEESVDLFIWDAGLARGVGNRVWLDIGNGVQTGGEDCLAGVTVNLRDTLAALAQEAVLAAHRPRRPPP